MDEIPTPPNPFVADAASESLALPSLLDLYFWPGDWVAYAAVRYLPPLADWLGLAPEDYRGTFSGFASLVVWLLAILAAIIGYAAVRDFDRALTRRIAALYTELLRHVRMAMVFATYRHHRRQVERKEPVFDLKEVPGLSRDELRVLDLHANLAPGYALAVSDVAEKLKARGYEVQAALERLRSLELLRSTVGSLYDEAAYTLTPAGRALLSAHRVRRA
jgi:hypothetical protein